MSPTEIAVGAGFLVLAVLIQRTRARAERIDSLRKTMNEAIIHDLKNPMTSIMGCLSYLLHDKPAEAEREKLLALALHGCRAQMTLLETLVDTNRLEQGELSLRKTELDTRHLLNTCLDDVRGAAVRLGVQLKEEHSALLPPTLHVDPDLFPRVLLNLLHNALKYTPAGGTVSLLTAPRDGGVRFEVRDTGIGISPENISRLFNKYYRVEGPDQTSRRGSGLGLYFCRLVVEAHGGKIAVSSDVGRGTAIVFDIPCAVPIGA
ncbi:MAG: HAMP domain-containing histidine kinase [Elusimicrobia bacterium]|nr:HAMP domain-containing histidine kinase [Elusimicrobiota bacterium]